MDNEFLLDPVSPTERNTAMFAHLLTFSGFIIPFGNVIGPLVIYLMKKDESEFVRAHAVEALNFQICMTIYLIISAILAFLLIGIPLLIVLGVLDLIVTIIAAVKASNGEEYRYPLSYRFVS